MEIIINRQKVDLSFKNESILIPNLLVSEMEIVIECGSSLINKTVILIFLDKGNQTYRQTLNLSEPRVKPIFDSDKYPEPLTELMIDANGCENSSIYISIYKNEGHFINF